MSLSPRWTSPSVDLKLVLVLLHALVRLLFLLSQSSHWSSLSIDHSPLRCPSPRSSSSSPSCPTPLIGPRRLSTSNSSLFFSPCLLLLLELLLLLSLSSMSFSSYSLLLLLLPPPALTPSSSHSLFLLSLALTRSHSLCRPLCLPLKHAPHSIRLLLLHLLLSSLSPLPFLLHPPFLGSLRRIPLHLHRPSTSAQGPRLGSSMESHPISSDLSPTDAPPCAASARDHSDSLYLGVGERQRLLWCAAPPPQWSASTRPSSKGRHVALFQK